MRLIPPAYVKPFVKRNKNDAIDAEAICEAAQRPGMRFVAVKSEEQQAAGLVFRTRDLVVRQRTQLINAIRGHLAEYGWVAPRGTAHMTMLADLLEDEAMTSTLPEAARPMFKLMVDLLGELDKQIAVLDREIARRAKEDDAARRLMTIPGIGPIAATAIIALAPPIETFRKGRDFAAWLGLTPRQHSTGGKQRLGSISKMGERTIRRLLIIGGSSMVRRPVATAHQPAHGWSVCWRASRACSSRSRSPTRWRAWPGRCSRKRKITGLRQRSRRKPGRRSEAWGLGGRRRVWHNSRRDGAGRTREWQSATQARKAEMVPVRELAYWPAAMALLIEAGQMTASDYVPTYPDLALAFEGASTDAIPQSPQFRPFLKAVVVLSYRCGRLQGSDRPPRSGD